MPPRSPRPVLRNQPCKGIGGYVRIQWRTFNDESTPDQHAGEKLRIARWMIEHTYTNVEIPAGGGAGSMTIRRVADGFRFVIEVDLDIGDEINPFEQSDSIDGQPFMDGRFDGDRNFPRVAGGGRNDYRIAVKFQVGDPSVWGNPEATIPVATSKKGIYYFCPDVLLDKVTTVNTIRKPGVVACVVEGRGSSPLQRWVNNSWCGAGAFGFDYESIGGPG